MGSDGARSARICHKQQYQQQFALSELPANHCERIKPYWRKADTYIAANTREQIQADKLCRARLADHPASCSLYPLTVLTGCAADVFILPGCDVQDQLLK